MWQSTPDLPAVHRTTHLNTGAGVGVIAHRAPASVFLVRSAAIPVWHAIRLFCTTIEFAIPFMRSSNPNQLRPFNPFVCS
ncbi:hypothetical protein AYO43_00460 [Nitrospira sp. SCGC AG-212-E16]|nr:hypothetical protein AYO43_00460 [Nitrospira sp. SCGC AG-212-E16]